MSISLAYGNDFEKMIYNGVRRLYHIEGNVLINLSKFVKQTYIEDLPKIIKNEIIGVIDNGYSDNIEVHIGEVNKKVLIILPGFFSTTASLNKIKKELSDKNYGYYALNFRLTYLNHKNKRNIIIRETIKILEKLEREKKDVILFGYSYGGALAETIGKRKKINTITLSTGNNFDNTPLVVIGKFFINLMKILKTNNIFKYYNYKIYKEIYDKNALGSTNVVNSTRIGHIYKIIENFSFSVDLPKEQRKYCHILKDTFSHFAVEQPDAIDAIIEGIKYFEKNSKN